MSIWRPDPTFYPSPKMAMDAPAEKLAYVAMVNGKDNGRHDAMGVVDVDPAPRAMAISSARWTCRMPAMSCIISVGMHAARACARTLRIPMWNAVTWWCRESLLADPYHRHQT